MHLSTKLTKLSPLLRVSRSRSRSRSRLSRSSSRSSSTSSILSNCFLCPVGSMLLTPDNVKTRKRTAIHKALPLNIKLRSRYFSSKSHLRTTETFGTLQIQRFLSSFKNDIIYEDDNLLALNKPNGLSVYGHGENSDEMSLKETLPLLKEELQCPALNIGISLKRYHSGVVVLTKNKMAANKLRRFVNHANAHKQCFLSFLAITVGTPVCQLNEDIELVVKRDFLHDREMVFSLVVEEDLSRKEQRALRNQGALIKVSLNLQVLTENKATQSALVQIKANKYKWDACEMFLSHFLSPVLGDNVYSSRTHYVMDIPFPAPPYVAMPGPQKLPTKLLPALSHHESNLNVDNLPLFLHLHKMTISRFPKPSLPSFDISACPPEAFVTALKVLGLYPKPVQRLIS